MRRFIATFLTLIFVMASLPLQHAVADFSVAEHGETSVATILEHELSADCCEMPMSSAHHGNLHCSMDCPAIAAQPLVFNADYAAQFSISNDEHRVAHAVPAHFRPPIFA